MVKILGVLIATALVSLSLSGHSAARRAGVNSADDPVVVMYRTTEKGRELVTAVWKDGTMLIRGVVSDINSRLIVAEAKPESVSACLQAMDAAHFFQGPALIHKQPDSSSIRIWAKYDEKSNHHEWNEQLETALKSQGMIEFVDRWLAARAAILRIAPVRSRPLADSLDERRQFRGFNPAEPGECKWIK
ncbi:MAG: hypothetical protein IT432_01180 [Phycisphaerales bacterium]|nr:hypothetical protein [Phycisphaerales bacterium]